jgi:hypothetical protein
MERLRITPMSAVANRYAGAGVPLTKRRRHIRKKKQTRRMKRLRGGGITEAQFRDLITEEKFIDYLISKGFDRADFSCGRHKNFVLHQLGYIEDFPEDGVNLDMTTYHPLDYLGTKEGALTIEGIPDLMNELDKGAPIVFYHDYNDFMGKTFNSLPEDNRYGNHVFVITKIGDKYFMTQGFLHRYAHKITELDKTGVETMITAIINELSDYGRDKTWADINFDTFKHYFGTELTAYPDIPLKKTNKVMGINLTFVKTKKV